MPWRCWLERRTLGARQCPRRMNLGSKPEWPFVSPHGARHAVHDSDEPCGGLRSGCLVDLSVSMVDPRGFPRWNGRRRGRAKATQIAPRHDSREVRDQTPSQLGQDISWSRIRSGVTDSSEPGGGRRPAPAIAWTCRIGWSRESVSVRGTDDCGAMRRRSRLLHHTTRLRSLSVRDDAYRRTQFSSRHDDAEPGQSVPRRTSHEVADRTPASVWHDGSHRGARCGAERRTPTRTVQAPVCAV